RNPGGTQAQQSGKSLGECRPAFREQRVPGTAPADPADDRTVRPDDRLEPGLSRGGRLHPRHDRETERLAKPLELSDQPKNVLASSHSRPFPGHASRGLEGMPGRLPDERGKRPPLPKRLTRTFDLGRSVEVDQYPRVLHRNLDRFARMPKVKFATTFVARD